MKLDKYAFTALIVCILSGASSDAVVHASGNTPAPIGAREYQVCQTNYGIPVNKWQMISLPCEPPADKNTVAAIFGNDLSGVYGSEWVVYSYLDSLGGYKKESLDSQLKQGKGYWIISTAGDATLNFPEGSKQAPTSVAADSAACMSNNGCFEIPVTTNVSNPEWNLLGHPYLSDTLISELRIITDAPTSPNDCGDANGCTPDEAREDDIIHHQFWTYPNPDTGGYLDLTSADKFKPWMGFWVAALQNSAGKNPRLLIPSSHDTYPPTYFPDPVRFNDWEPAIERMVTAPDFLDFINDNDTHKPVWRLGGDGLEMGNKLNHPDGNGTISEANAQHFYSRTTPANKDETYAMGAGRGGHAALWRISDKQLVAWVPSPFPAADNQQWQILWDKNDNNVYWYTEGNKLKRVTINLTTFAVVKNEVWDTFPGYGYIAFGPGEGDFSDDGKRLVIVGSVIDAAENFDIISYLVENKRRVATKTIPATSDFRLDWAGIDPTGQYVVFNRPSQGRSTWILPFNLEGNPRLLYLHMKHSDFVIDNQQEPWLVFGHYQGLFATKLSSSLLKRVWPTAVDAGDPVNYQNAEIQTDIIETASGHVSRVSGFPGVVLVSRNVDGGLYFINIDDSGKTVYAGNTRHGKRPANDPLPKEDWGVDVNGETVGPDGSKAYPREPRASASQSGKHIFFVSDYHVHGTGYAVNPKPAFRAFLNMIELSP